MQSFWQALCALFTPRPDVTEQEEPKPRTAEEVRASIQARNIRDLEEDTDDVLRTVRLYASAHRYDITTHVWNGLVPDELRRLGYTVTPTNQASMYNISWYKPSDLEIIKQDEQR